MSRNKDPKEKVQLQKHTY